MSDGESTRRGITQSELDRLGVTGDSGQPTPTDDASSFTVSVTPGSERTPPPRMRPPPPAYDPESVDDDSLQTSPGVSAMAKLPPPPAESPSPEQNRGVSRPLATPDAGVPRRTIPPPPPGESPSPMDQSPAVTFAGVSRRGGLTSSSSSLGSRRVAPGRVVPGPPVASPSVELNGSRQEESSVSEGVSPVDQSQLTNPLHDTDNDVPGRTTGSGGVQFFGGAQPVAQGQTSQRSKESRRSEFSSVHFREVVEFVPLPPAPPPQVAYFKIPETKRHDRPPIDHEMFFGLFFCSEPDSDAMDFFHALMDTSVSSHHSMATHEARMEEVKQVADDESDEAQEATALEDAPEPTGSKKARTNEEPRPAVKAGSQKVSSKESRRSKESMDSDAFMDAISGLNDSKMNSSEFAVAVDNLNNSKESKRSSLRDSKEGAARKKNALS